MKVSDIQRYLSEHGVGKSEGLQDLPVSHQIEPDFVHQIFLTGQLLLSMAKATTTGSETCIPMVVGDRDMA